MAEKKYSENFYAGADYGFDPKYGSDVSLGFSTEYRIPVSQFGPTTDARTANQLKAVSDKLNTGAKTIEVSGVSAAEWESVPEQHLKEIERLKKLAGVDLTLHGPLVEPTGVTKDGWNESHREMAERQMLSAVERAHKLDTKGNIVVTFHSSNGLPNPEERVMEEVVDPVTGKKKIREKIKEVWVVSNDGHFQHLTPKPNYFESREKEFETPEQQVNLIKEAIKKQNEDAWYHQLQNIGYHAYQGAEIVSKYVSGKELDEETKENTSKEEWLKLYKDYLKGEKVPKLLEKIGSPYKEAAERQLHGITHGDMYLRDAYQNLQNLFNQAYGVAKKDNKEEDLKKLDAFRAEIKDKLNDMKDPTKLISFANEIIRGVNVLRSIQPAEALKPLKEFAVDKASDTFSNVALNAYKKFGSTTPIISVENPPAGMGLSHAEDLRAVVEESRNKLKKKLIEKQGLSEYDAEEQAKKLIGVTWDVGHINMLRKYGYEEKDILKQTEKVAPLVKHVHLSDNFGMEHTELPMGMGNVPTKKMLEAIKKFNEKAKMIIETGGAWYRDFKVTPLRQTLQAFGSPIYSMKMAPYWTQVANTFGGYFAGYGQVLPEQHFSMYGAGFSNLPPELGGQMGGRQRMGGAPIE